MATEQILLDPTAEASGTQLDVTDGVAYFLLEHKYPAPEPDLLTASTVDTEGEVAYGVHYRNREITLKLRVAAASRAALDAALGALRQKVAKMTERGGTYRRIAASGVTVTFDVLAARWVEETFDKEYQNRYRTAVTLSFIAKPFGRGPAQVLRNDVMNVPTWYDQWTSTVPGDVPALGTLTIRHSGGAAQWATWGMRAKYYANGAGDWLYLEAENTPGAITGSRTGASGTVRTIATMPTGSYSKICSIQSGANANTHKGAYRLYLRAWVTQASSNINLRVYSQNYGEATSGPKIRNAPVSITGAGTRWVLCDLGLIYPDPDRSKYLLTLEGYGSSAADTVELDWFLLVPVTEGSGLVQMSPTGTVNLNDVSFTWAGCYSGTLPNLDPAPYYEGDYLLVPPSGAEGRPIEFLVYPSKTPRGDATSSASFFYTTLSVIPRYLVLPPA